MKLKNNMNVHKEVTCSFCKRKNTRKIIKGHPYGGRTCCDECFDNKIKPMDKKSNYKSLGEERAHRTHGI